MQRKDVVGALFLHLEGNYYYFSIFRKHELEIALKIYGNHNLLFATRINYFLNKCEIKNTYQNILNILNNQTSFNLNRKLYGLKNKIQFCAPNRFLQIPHKMVPNVYSSYSYKRSINTLCATNKS